MDEVNIQRSSYARMIEDGKKIEAFTSMNEWQWYVDKVINPTIEDLTNKIMEGKLSSDKADWITRGMVTALRMVVESTTGFIQSAEQAREDAKELEKQVKDNE